MQLYYLIIPFLLAYSNSLYERLFVNKSTPYSAYSILFSNNYSSSFSSIIIISRTIEYSSSNYSYNFYASSSVNFLFIYSFFHCYYNYADHSHFPRCSIHSALKLSFIDFNIFSLFHNKK
jgi:hypothetical protein